MFELNFVKSRQRFGCLRPTLSYRGRKRRFQNKRWMMIRDPGAKFSKTYDKLKWDFRHVFLYKNIKVLSLTYVNPTFMTIWPWNVNSQPTALCSTRLVLKSMTLRVVYIFHLNSKLNQRKKFTYVYFGRRLYSDCVRFVDNLARLLHPFCADCICWINWESIMKYEQTKHGCQSW